MNHLSLMCSKGSGQRVICTCRFCRQLRPNLCSFVTLDDHLRECFIRRLATPTNMIIQGEESGNEKEEERDSQRDANRHRGGYLRSCQQERWQRTHLPTTP